jgi:hypothetical protein
MEEVTGVDVGPGAYNVREVYSKLRQKPCFVKITNPYLEEEENYEMVNNTRILQPNYIRRRSLKIAFEHNL